MKRAITALSFLVLSVIPAFAGVTIGTYGGVGSAGWSTITPTSITTGTCAAGTADGTCIYYASATGSNAGPNTCLSSASPCRTLAYAVGKLRSGKPDWLLLKNGDTWTSESLGVINISGKSATEPMVFASYDPANPTVPDPGTGGARPLIQTPNVDVVPGDNSHVALKLGGDFYAIIGLNFYSYQRDPTNGAYVGSGSIADDDGLSISPLAANPAFILIEDNLIHFYGTDIGFSAATDTPGGNTYIRRNIILNAWNTCCHSQGLHPGNATNLVVEENILDSNGWYPPSGNADLFSRNLYHTQCGNAACTIGGPPMASYRGNISSRSSSEGVQFRTGVTLASDNLFASNTAGFDVGHQTGDISFPLASVNTITNNVVIDSTTHSGVPEAGAGINVFNAPSGGVTITSNLIVHQHTGLTSYSMETDMVTQAITYAGNIVYDWGSIPGAHDEGVGAIESWTITNGGSSYADGTYNVISMSTLFTSNNCRSSAFKLTVAGGAVTNTQMVVNGYNGSPVDSPGIGCAVGDTLTAASGIGAGTGFVLTVNSIGAGSTVTPNDINCTTCYNGGTYPDTTRTVDTYAGTLGLSPATLDTLISTARATLSKANWNTAYLAPAINSYIRSGFGVKRGSWLGRLGMLDPALYNVIGMP